MDQDIKRVDDVLAANGWSRVDEKSVCVKPNGNPLHVWRLDEPGGFFECQLTEPQPTFAFGEKNILILYFDKGYVRILINVIDKMDDVLKTLVERQEQAMKYYIEQKPGECMEELARPLATVCPTCVFVEVIDTSERTMVMGEDMVDESGPDNT